ncbi:MAG: DUF2157 domain-containing protein [Potamolinea sp.]
MLSDKFRRQLQQEIDQWRTDKLIDDSLYEQLSQRYQFSDLEISARNRFVVILLGLGSVLLGLGVITFVAANWQFWSRESKVILLLSGFIGINTAGFYLWRRPTERWQRRLGHGLLLLGAIVLGANMALMSQMFHQSGGVYQLYIVWGLGVLAMAYSLQLTSLGILAFLLIGLGYVQSFWQQPEFVAIGEFSWLRFLVQHMPLLSLLMFIPLAYWCRSRWIFRLGAIAVVSSLEANLLGVNLWGSNAWLAASACALPPALLWAYNDSLWRQRFIGTESFNSTARTLAVTFLSLMFYVLAFYEIWNKSSVISTEEAALINLNGFIVLDILILGSLTVWQWIRLLRRMDGTSITLAIMTAISALIAYWHLSLGRLQITAVLVFNVLLFILAVGLIREGIRDSRRRIFWGGMVLLTMQIFSRMLEYETELIFKAIVLLLCGFGVIAAGLWFERSVRIRR